MGQVRLDYQFHGRDTIQINFIVLNLAGRAGRTEIILLAHDLLGLSTVRRGPSNGEFLKTVPRWLQKVKLYAMQRDRLIEDEANLLLALLGGSPAWPARGAKDGFDGKAGIFRSDFDSRDLPKIHPTRTGPRFGRRTVRTNNSLPHAPILSEGDAFDKGNKGSRIWPSGATLVQPFEKGAELLLFAAAERAHHCADKTQMVGKRCRHQLTPAWRQTNHIGAASRS